MAEQQPPLTEAVPEQPSHRRSARHRGADSSPHAVPPPPASDLVDVSDFYEQLLEVAPDGFVLVDGDGQIRLVNRQAELLFGWQRADLIGQQLEMLIPDRVRAVHPAHRSTYFAEPRTRPMAAGLELTGLRADGTEFPVDISLSPLVTGQGTLVCAAIRDASDRKAVEAQLREANNRLRDTVAVMERQGRELTMVNELGDMLQSCLSSEEAYDVIGHFAPKLFPTSSGVVLRSSHQSNALESVAAWGSQSASSLVFSPEDCWAVRRGRVHRVGPVDRGVRCPHLEGTSTAWSICIPMMAQGEILGLLQVSGEEAAGDEVGIVERLAVTIAEHVSLALANLRLRETLRVQSMHDPLTGLWNRRYLDDSLGREILRAERTGRPVGVITFDLDGFKDYNDALGHDAGDQLLRLLAQTVGDAVRTSDLLCRPGGDEFVLVLTDSPMESTRERAEAVRKTIETLMPLTAPAVTASFGVACYPLNGHTPSALLKAADRALYAAKDAGKNCVMVAASAH